MGVESEGESEKREWASREVDEIDETECTRSRSVDGVRVEMMRVGMLVGAIDVRGEELGV